jgi:uridine kinase
MNNPYIIGITGGSASGKTVFLNGLMEKFGHDDICLISQDNYYKPRDTQPKDENGIINFDTTESIDYISFAKDIADLKSGKIVKKKEYTFNNPNVVPKELIFKPSPIIVVEGLFVFYFPEIASQLNLKVFIDSHLYLMLKRRIIRDATERGYDLNDVLYRFEKHVVPAYHTYIEPLRHDADIIVPNNSDFRKGLAVLSAHLKVILDDYRTNEKV